MYMYFKPFTFALFFKMYKFCCTSSAHQKSWHRLKISRNSKLFRFVKDLQGGDWWDHIKPWRSDNISGQVWWWFLAQLLFKEKKSRYCHHSGVGGGGGVVVVAVVTNFSLGYYFKSAEANSWNFIHLLTIVRATIWPRFTYLQWLLAKLCPLTDIRNRVCVDYRPVNGWLLCWL